jgi:Fe2+ transport system protein FeoA
MIKESTNISQAGPVNLNELKIGNKCEIVAISGERKLRRRLMEMGLLEGSQLRVVKFGPTGDPIQVQVNDYFLSLRRNEAARVVVRITAAEQ